MSEKRKEQERNPSDPFVWDVEELASATECVGLVPAAIQTPEEAETYSQLFGIHQQKTAWEGEQDGVPDKRDHAE